MRIIKLFFLFYLIAIHTHAQIQFDKRYPLGLATLGLKVVEIPGGYITVGANISDTNIFNNNIIVKTDYYGDTIKTLYLLTHDSVFWSLYNQDPDDNFPDIIMTSDSNLMVLGRSQAFNPNNTYHYDIWLVKLNFNLDTVWTKSYTHSNTDTSLIPQSLIQTNDGGFLICGKQRNLGFTNYYGFLYKVDSAGNFQWYKSYNNPGPFQAIWDVIELPDHSFMCTGNNINTINGDLDAFYFYVDSLGNQFAVFTIPTLGNSAFCELIESNNNSFVMIGSENFSSGSIQPYINSIVKINSTGSIIWKKNYLPFNSVGSALVVAKALNGGYIYSGLSDNTTNYVKAYIHRLDENGDSLWYREFGSSSYSDFWDIKTTSDGGYIMCGQTGGCNNNGGTCFWLVKTDSLGLLVTGIKEETIFKAATLTVYPNPTTTYCTITATVPQTNNTGAGKKGASIIFLTCPPLQLA